MPRETSQEIIDKIKEKFGIVPVLEEEQETKIHTELFIEGKYLQTTETYRRQITLAQDQKKKLILALRCIRDLTGDQLFYKSNIRQLEGEKCFIVDRK